MHKLELFYSDGAECPFNEVGQDIVQAEGVDGLGTPYRFANGHVQFVAEFTKDGQKGKRVLIGLKPA